MAANVLHQDPIHVHFSILVEKVNSLVNVEEIFPRGFSMYNTKSRFEASNVLDHFFASGIEIEAWTWD